MSRATGIQSLITDSSDLLHKARGWYFKRSMREKVLMLLFAFVLLALWYSWRVDRGVVLKAAHEDARRDENAQRLVLNDGPMVRNDYAYRIANIDLDALPSREEVSGQIDALVRRSGFSDFDLGQPRTQQGADLRFHTFQLRVNKSTFERIESFERSVKRELPHVALERVVLQAQPRDDQFLDASFVFKSIEPAQ